MDITLVTSTYNDDVHGTDNDKRTGCGISLFKPENITRFRRGDVMTDLKEITCEKCKAALAKKIIKSDKKEMSRIIKEEKLRAKKVSRTKVLSLSEILQQELQVSHVRLRSR